MPNDELHDRNFVRINRINWILTPVLFFFFGWPFYELAQLFNVATEFGILGSLSFAFGFTVTILHGHVTVAVGTSHRNLYYNWLEEHPLSHGLFFHKAMISTRIRLLTLVFAFAILIFGIVAK